MLDILTSWAIIYYILCYMYLFLSYEWVSRTVKCRKLQRIYLENTCGPPHIVVHIYILMWHPLPYKTSLDLIYKPKCKLWKVTFLTCIAVFYLSSQSNELYNLTSFISGRYILIPYEGNNWTVTLYNFNLIKWIILKNKSPFVFFFSENVYWICANS